MQTSLHISILTAIRTAQGVISTPPGVPLTGYYSGIHALEAWQVHSLKYNCNAFDERAIPPG
jgi:hypothetical protein